ncbi:hypothetical protein PDJAM_G00154020 [Pangasius djambal]|uniref:Uncharacterized protein n=1 Tax=Pangasius djambal TaxID=1691987 RepID=A0ACC5ZHH5_9TELE|nr:hypothetical protein [Pangasius djambal]
MRLKLEIEGVMLNVVSGYVPQVGCELEEKERLWSELDEVIESIPMGERVVIGADFNGHVGEGNTGDEEVMGRFGVKERNLEGQMVVDFAKRMDMAVVNTYFQKREEHRVTLKSGGRSTQVVLPDDWETTAEVIRVTGRKVLGVSSGRTKEDKETWWWNEEVEDSIQRLAKKKWNMDRTEENRQEYKELQRRVKREVSKAKPRSKAKQECGFRTPLPSIHLPNLRSLENKSDELQLLTRTNKDFLNSAALCFTETWLNGAIRDSALHLTSFQLFKADRVTELSGKTRGGGLCFYINEGWCKDVTVLKKMCCSDLEALFINCKPFYSPREFSSFIMVSAYISPDAHVSAALELLADQITHTEQRYPDSFIIILCDFNKANLTRELPKYRQHITCPTRDSNILDHCYTVLKNAYHSVPRAALGLSDHCLVHLLPAYKQKLKSAKPVVKTVKRWTTEAEWDLQACFDCTDWSVFEAAATDLDELTDTVMSYISFCEDLCVPTGTYLTFNNDKPWFSAKLKQLRQAKEDAYRSGDKALYKQAKYTLNREIRVAKQNYSEKLKKQLSSNDSTSVWKGLKAITSYKTPFPSTEANRHLAEDLNEFYCRFEKPRLTPRTRSDHLTTQPSSPSPSLPPIVSQPVLKICEDDVRKVFRKQKIRKAKGPDGVSPACLKACAVQLSSIFTLIFNRSLELCEVPSCFKHSTIIPVPKKPKITGLNDYRPVALTSVVMKSFERLVLAYLKDITGPLLDPLQFAYRANRAETESQAFSTNISV